MIFEKLTTTDQTLIFGIIVFVLKDWIMSPRRELKELKSVVSSLGQAVTRLTVHLEFLEKRTEQIPELRKDLNGLGLKLRDQPKRRRDS